MNLPDAPQAQEDPQAAAAKAAEAAKRAQACKDAHKAATEAASAAAAALHIDPPTDSPLVQELTELGKAIPNGKDAEEVRDFLEQMEQLRQAAETLKATAS